ncbi:MAG: serine/threonine protein kinase [Candidatus Heimdallarchaeota archaeon]|nr:MAG: serine/threonine protein kinase [Candidatus Heimdallarchaeota archaeon]
MMPLSVADFFLKLTQFDFRILSVIEVLMAKYEIVPTEEIAAYLHYSEKKIQKALNKLQQYKLILIAQRHYLGAALTFLGYDALALKALVEKGTIAQIGPEVGAGKESDIRLAIDDQGCEFILKMHRLGKLDFRATKRARAFIAEKSHISPLYESRLSAEREFKALSDLFNAGVSVPQPIIQNRHIVAMHIIIGQDLYRVKKNEFQTEKDILTLFNNIIHEMQSVVRQGYIHGDLSEYNIRLNEDNYPVFFDWPQYVETESKQARRILTRDLSNILNYFRKKFQMTIQKNVSELLLQYFENLE